MSYTGFMHGNPRKIQTPDLSIAKAPEQPHYKLSLTKSSMYQRVKKILPVEIPTMKYTHFSKTGVYHWLEFNSYRVTVRQIFGEIRIELSEWQDSGYKDVRAYKYSYEDFETLLTDKLSAQMKLADCS